MTLLAAARARASSADPHLIEQREEPRVRLDVARSLRDEDDPAAVAQGHRRGEVDDAAIRCGPRAACLRGWQRGRAADLLLERAVAQSRQVQRVFPEPG